MDQFPHKNLNNIIVIILLFMPTNNLRWSPIFENVND